MLFLDAYMAGQANFWDNCHLPRPSKRRWRKRLFIWGGLLILLVILFYLEENYRHRRAWRDYAQAVGLQQKPLNWRDYLPQPVPENQNFTKTPLLRAIGLRNETDQATLRRFTTLPVGQFTADANKGTPSNLEGLAAALAEQKSPAYEPAKSAIDVVLAAMAPIEPDLAELRRASHMPYAQFDARGDDPWALTIPNFVALRSLAQILSVHAGAMLQQGQGDTAMEDLRVILRLADALESHHTLVAAMIRVALVNVALGPFREGCVAGLWSSTELREFQDLLQGQDLLSSTATSLQAGERAGIHYIVEHYSPDQWTRIFTGSEKPNHLLRVGLWLAPRGWKYRALMLYDEPMREFYEAIDSAAQRIDPVRAQAAFDQAEEAVKQRPFGLLTAVATPNFQKALLTTARTQTMVNMAEVICALERYKGVLGDYPKDLEALAPTFLGARLPHDLVTGGSLSYAMTSPGKFTLHTTGYDGKDDDGRIDSDPVRGDWCWIN